MNELNLHLIKVLYLRFSSIYGNKFYNNHTDSKIIEMWWNEWMLGLKGINADSIKAALSHCRLNLEWPPSIAEFRRLCQENSGFPSIDECLRAIIQRDFYHPIMKIIYEKIGSWAFSHEKESDLKRKVILSYKEAIVDMNKEMSLNLNKRLTSNVISITNEVA